MPTPQFKLGERPARDFANALGVFENRIMRTRRRTFVIHLERHQFFARPFFFGLQQNVAANEIRLCYIDKETESGLDWVPLRREIGAVEWVTHLQAQRVARAESAWLRAFFYNQLPKFRPVLISKENFDAVFAGITGARYRDRPAVRLYIDNVIVRRQ